MAGPYNPPNPYGSYFSFGQAEGVVHQSFGPMPYGVMSPAAMAAMGSGSGGFNPTPAEYLAGQVRNQYQQRFMAEVLRSDPRAQNITTALLNQMSASSQKSTLNLFGGRANFQEMVGSALSLPGISSLVGGSPYALAQGSLAAATGGMKIGGVGMFGDGAAGILGAQQIVQHMTRQFYFQGGGANTTATQGLSRDQIGGIMALGSAQGAFAGLNMGTFSTKGSQVALNMDQGTLAKISQFTKSAAKALSSLIDIYGDQSVAELAAKASQITGMSFNQLGNAQTIHQRLASLRQAGLATGVDTLTMFELAAAGTAKGRSLGLGENFSGNVGIAMAARAAGVFKVNQGQAGSFRTATPSLQEIQAGLVRDVAGMSMDPIGRRRMALQLGVETGHFTGSAADEARRLIREDGPGAMGRIDAFMGKSEISTDSYIRLMGGPEGMSNLLSEGGMDTIREGFLDTVGTRARTAMRTRAVRAFGSRITGTAGSALMDSIEGVGKETLEKIFQATKSGWNESQVTELLQGDPAGRLNTKKYLDTLRTAVNGFRPGEAAALHASMQQAISTDTFLSNSFMSESGRMSEAANRMSMLPFSEGERGAMRQGLFEGLLAKMSGSDPKTNFVRAMMTYKDSVIGVHGGIVLPNPGEKLSPDVLMTTAGVLISGLSGTKEGQDALRVFNLQNKKAGDKLTTLEMTELNRSLADPIQREKAFRGRFRTANMGNGLTWLIDEKKYLYASEWGTDMKIGAELGAKAGGWRGDMLSRTAEFMMGHPESAEASWKQLVSLSSDIEMLSRLPAGQLKAIAEASPRLGKAIAHNIEAQVTSATKRGDKASITEGNKVLDVLNATTGREGGGDSFVLSGSLDLVGGALQLKEAMLKQGKK